MADRPIMPPEPDSLSSGAESVFDEPAHHGRHERDAEHVADEPALVAMPTAGSLTYGERYLAARAASTWWQRWGVVFFASVLAGPFAIGAALLGVGQVGFSLASFVAVVLLAPPVEELLKVAGSLFLAELRPWLVPAAWTLVAIALISGLVFATVENLLYLNVYIENPSPEITRWRWIAGPLLHGGASLIAGVGVARMWNLTNSTGSAPQLGVATPFLVTASLLHAAYNLTVLILESTGLIFAI